MVDWKQRAKKSAPNEFMKTKKLSVFPNELLKIKEIAINWGELRAVAVLRSEQILDALPTPALTSLQRWELSTSGAERPPEKSRSLPLCICKQKGLSERQGRHENGSDWIKAI